MNAEVAENGTAKRNIFSIPSDKKERQGTCETLNGIPCRIF